MLSSCLPPNLPCDFPSTRIRVCTCLNEQYICRYCRETYYVILNRVQYACAFLCERFPLNTFLFTVMKSKLSCFIVKNIPCWHNYVSGAHGTAMIKEGSVLLNIATVQFCERVSMCVSSMHDSRCFPIWEISYVGYKIELKRSIENFILMYNNRFTIM